MEGFSVYLNGTSNSYLRLDEGVYRLQIAAVESSFVGQLQAMK
jgi:hypothetical protein